jgi:hypothetical protein
MCWKDLEGCFYIHVIVFIGHMILDSSLSFIYIDINVEYSSDIIYIKMFE